MNITVDKPPTLSIHQPCTTWADTQPASHCDVFLLSPSQSTKHFTRNPRHNEKERSRGTFELLVPPFFNIKKNRESDENLRRQTANQIRAPSLPTRSAHTQNIYIHYSFSGGDLLSHNPPAIRSNNKTRARDDE